MKTSVALAGLLAGSFVLSLSAQTSATTQQAAPAQQTQGSKATQPGKAAPKAGTTTAPMATKTAPADTKAKKAEPAPVIPGVTIPRENKFLGVEIVNGTFKLSFYDDKKKAVTPDVPSAVLRWDTKATKSGRDRVMLSSDGKALTSPKVIRPPYNFKLTIVLLKEATENEEGVGETFTIDFHQG